jgi:hypothetical protein
MGRPSTLEGTARQEDGRIAEVVVSGFATIVGHGTMIFPSAYVDGAASAVIQALFLANAASCLIFAAVLIFLPTLRTAPARKERRASYRDVLAHSGLRLALVASLIVAFTGYPAFDSGLPAYASVEAHVSARIVALSLTVNTALIVLAQLLADGPTRSPPSPSPWRSSSALHLLPASSPPVRPQSGSACSVPAASAPSPRHRDHGGRARPVSRSRGVCTTDRPDDPPPDRAAAAGNDPGRLTMKSSASAGPVAFAVLDRRRER